ncbi:preprotein translocase subunit SecA [Streptomyces luomodiensis]|uniref:Preprotein translocase subunit SecA n=1 Tax=Streptomyces luomodiensis TaxID=3026192 RepID=A0ABY9V9K8_9ACTN|nr:preprotein translocase subunit SecA [Streptomyces sp. SCA4-21]WNF01307.1 preprotein translocase subunit SecA [Streptomyces sp. SCA4-21]
MSSRSKRRVTRNKRKRRAGSATPAFDPHAQVMAESFAALVELVPTVAGDDPVAKADAAFDDAVQELVAKLRRFDAIRLIEVARLAFLPLAPAGQMPVTPEAGAAYLELLALVALAAQDETATADAPEVEFQQMSHFVSEVKDDLGKILHLAQLRSLAAVDPADKLALMSLLVRGAEVWMRNMSYSEMVEKTNLVLLDGDPSVRAALNDQLGFDATDALAVLDACHHLQHAGLNDRLNAMGGAMQIAMAATHKGRGDDRLKERARSSLMSLFEPGAEQATVAVDDIAAHTGIAVERVRAVVERFRLDLGTDGPADVIDAFTTGKNPMRTRPLIVSDSGRLMLPHHALNVFAVRENLEEQLKTSQPVWAQYAKHRGDLLELRTRDALGRVLPGARFRDAFEYYLPANDQETEAAEPAKYTKRVEGDHLVVLDDVAIIVEDKAVALSALSRGGKRTRLRTDLTGIITKAAEQSGRMRDAIQRDGGLRIENEGWVDLSHVREIHTVVVSLDDLSTVLTATAEMVKAGLLDPDNIPWTVSLHDLELIIELVARPAEFLLYLRRRRNPDVTVMFRAPDELDLFLYFFEAGLWVEPDPAQVRVAFPFLSEPTTAELRRYREQQPVYLSSRTDALDRWFYAKQCDDEGSEPVPKPAMVPTPLVPLIDELQSRQVTGWLSIGATLLSIAEAVQHQFARHGEQLLNHPDPNGRGRSMTVPITQDIDAAEGWLFVWATCPAGQAPDDAEKSLRGYLRAKKHQLGLPRGVVFLYDEPTHDLVEVLYDGHIGPPDAALTASMQSLRPATDFQRAIHPNAKRPPRRTKSTPKRKP